MKQINYQVMGEFGKFMPMNTGNLTQAIGAPAYSALNNFDTDHLSRMTTNSNRKASKAGKRVSVGGITISLAIEGRIKSDINRALPNKQGKYLFVAKVIVDREQSLATGVRTVNIVRTNTPNSTARYMSQCATGQVSCLNNTPLNKRIIEVSVFVLVEVK